MSDNITDTILFIGAGFSRAAGVPLMSEFVSRFENRLKEKGDDYHRYFLTITKHMDEVTGGKGVDLEKLMDILYRLAEGNTAEMSMWQEKEDLAAFDHEIRESARSELENLIREKCIINPDTKLDDYSALNEVFKAIKPLDVFSVNYDDVLEVFCYKNKYTLEDGFALYWEPGRFDDLSGVDVRLLKLHGSVLWYRTQEGAFYKILLDVPKEYNRLVTGEQLEQLIAYPVAGKPIHVAPLAYALNELRRRLEEVSQCIIIGYSMRDEHLIDIFIEALRRNDKLRLILVNPDPFSIAKNIKHKALSRSVIPASFKTEEIMYGNKLLLISNFVRKASEQPIFEIMKNPFKATQDCFQALDYSTALMLINTERFWQYCEGINVRTLDFSYILGGLSYTHILSVLLNNEGLRNTVFDHLVRLIKCAAISSVKENSEMQLLCERGIQANEWVMQYLQGQFRQEVERICKMRINALEHTIRELARNVDSTIDEQKRILEKQATILFKVSSDPLVPYDDGGFHWLFDREGQWDVESF